MAVDALGALQAARTIAATTNSTGYDLKTRAPISPMYARVIYSAATNASGSNSVTYSIQESSDNSTFYAHTSAAAQIINLSTVAAAGEIFIPIITAMRYIRLVATFAGAGSTPTITDEAYITNCRP